MWKFIGILSAFVAVVCVTFVVTQEFAGPQGSATTTTAPTTTVAPTSTAAGATTTTTLPQVSPEGMTVVKATDLVEAKRQALMAIPPDQTVAVEVAKAEYSQARGILVDAQNAALPQPSMLLSWVQLAISIAMMIFMVIVVVVVLRSQPKKAKPQPPARRQTAPVQTSPKHRRTTTAPWAEEKAFEAWFYAQPDEVRPLLLKERKSWPPGQETARWSALREALADQSVSSTP